MRSVKDMEDIAYYQKFGNIPDDQLERVKFILGRRSKDLKFNQMIQLKAKKIRGIKKKSIRFTMWKVIRPSARPRANTTAGFVNMYVPRARENGLWFEQFAKEHNLPVIDTPCELNMRIYEKTPSSFNITQTVLAECGLIRPWKRTGDFDNYAKGIADCIQHGMLKDDCLVIKSTQELLYSIKPHADIELIYLSKFPEI